MSPNRSIGRLQGASFPSEMGPHLIIISGVFRKHSPKVLRVEHEQMVRRAGSSRSSIQYIRSVKASGTRWAGPGSPLLGCASLMQHEAYALAGYKANDGNASRLPAQPFDRVVSALTAASEAGDVTSAVLQKYQLQYWRGAAARPLARCGASTGCPRIDRGD